jgi:hypothetical protein
MSGIGARLERLRQRQIHVADGLIDLLRALEADRGAVHTRILKSKPHRLHAVVVTMAKFCKKVANPLIDARN